MSEVQEQVYAGAGQLSSSLWGDINETDINDLSLLKHLVYQKIKKKSFVYEKFIGL